MTTRTTCPTCGGVYGIARLPDGMCSKCRAGYAAAVADHVKWLRKQSSTGVFFGDAIERGEARGAAKRNT